MIEIEKDCIIIIIILLFMI